MYTIRQATINDASAVLDITRRAFEIYRQSLDSAAPVAALSETAEQVKADIKSGRVFVIAETPCHCERREAIPCKEKLLGTIRYELLSPDLAYIYRFGVDPEVANGGVGSDLLSYCIDRIKQEGCKAAALHTNSRYFKLARYYYGKDFFVHSTDNSMGYIRALFVKQFDHDTDADVSPAFNK